VAGKWGGLIEYSREEDIVTRTADLLSDGAVIGWVQGRSEFGPRALGNRSILADPRPAENKNRINAMIKKREAYRPFAPTVVEEQVSEYFVAPDGDTLSFMTFVVDVEPSKRELLGAVTHVDGTARVQTVSRDQNPRYWSLIKAFGDRTGVPMLLNTSFNNNEEPIVDSVEDAIVCFLTTDLDYLVVGDYLIRKKGELRVSVGDLIPVLPRYVWLSASTLPGNPNGARRYQLRTTFDERKDFEIDRDTFRLLESIDGKTTLNCLAERVLEGASERRAELTTSILELWSRRLIRIKPRAA
jgi:carbamoyltransferase